MLYLAITVLMDDCASWDLSLNFPLIFLYSTLLRLKKFKSKEWVKTYSEIKLHACRYCSVIWRNSVSCSEDTLILIFNVFVNIKTVFSKPYNPYILTVIVKKFFKIYSLSWQSSASDYKSEVSALLFFLMNGIICWNKMCTEKQNQHLKKSWFVHKLELGSVFVWIKFFHY